MPRGLTATEAAKRMGVKVQTIYAYVSRGLLESVPSGDGRTRLFDARAVDALARRGRPRQSSRSASLNLLIETGLTSLSPAGVRYRGISSGELARTHTFEQVADLLWLGHLSDAHVPWTALALEAPAGATLTQALRVAVAHLSVVAPPVRELTAANVAATGRTLIATVVDSLPAVRDGHTPRLQRPAGGAPLRGTIAGRLWPRLSPRRPGPGLLAVLNAALVLLADHELAASTLAVRVAASTRADPYAAVGAGLNVLSGPLHGGASRAARALIDDALAHGPALAVANSLGAHGRIPGFGHSVYIDADPRAVLLLDLLRRAGGGSRAMSVIDAVCEEAVSRAGRAPNSDFALAAMTSLSGMPPDAGEAVMAVARVAGWLAHAIEEYAETPLRFRPRASYVGP